MVEIFKTQQVELALNAYRIWVHRSIELGFYSASVLLTFNSSEWRVLIVGALYEAYAATLLL